MGVVQDSTQIKTINDQSHVKGISDPTTLIVRGRSCWLRPLITCKWYQLASSRRSEVGYKSGRLGLTFPS